MPARGYNLQKGRGGKSMKKQRKLSRKPLLLGIDWSLIPIFIASAYTGFELHSAGHSATHEIWEKWAMAHIISCVLFLFVGTYHIYIHWNWYKSLLANGLGKKSVVTLMLSVFFLLLVISGIVLVVAINGPNSHIGVLHYVCGILLSIFGCIHIIKRRAFLKIKKQT